jgi:16S rRNA (cytosine967-C5)-methyltransferase
MDVVAQFLETHPDFSLAPVLHPLTNEQTDGCVWIWPWMNCNGMFIANFIRDHMA